MWSFQNFICTNDINFDMTKEIISQFAAFTNNFMANRYLINISKFLFDKVLGVFAYIIVNYIFSVMILYENL